MSTVGMAESGRRGSRFSAALLGIGQSRASRVEAASTPPASARLKSRPKWCAVRPHNQLPIAMPPKAHPYDVGGALLAACAAKARAQGAIALCLHMAESRDVKTSSGGSELRRVPQLDFVALGTDHGLGETDRMTVRAYALPLQ